MSERIKAVVDAGAASAGPPLGPSLGPLGVNAGEVVKQINEKTASFKGMKVPVEVIVDTATKKFEIVVGSPPTSSLILKSVGLEKGGGSDWVGDLKMPALLQIAKDKMGSVLAKDLKSSVKEVVGTCQSLRITVEGRKPKHFIEEVELGRLDKVISGETTEMPEPIVHVEQKVSIVGQTKKEEGEAPVEEAKAAEVKTKDGKAEKGKEDKKPDAGGKSAEGGKTKK
ncbi:MAG TPA: 50S ribosomal protein L11 [Candidatus Altiarchaeales archaeon]|nr:50S ribosomal protein L11 [Candidatus Altiarchaeales archaeon]